MPQIFWVDAFQKTVYLINRLHSPMTNHVSTFSHLFEKPPNYKLLRVFGSLCYLISSPITLTNLIFSPYRVFSSFIVPFTGGIFVFINLRLMYILRNVVFD